MTVSLVFLGLLKGDYEVGNFSNLELYQIRKASEEVLKENERILSDFNKRNVVEQFDAVGFNIAKCLEEAVS